MSPFLIELKLGTYAYYYYGAVVCVLPQGAEICRWSELSPGFPFVEGDIGWSLEPMKYVSLGKMMMIDGCPIVIVRLRLSTIEKC